MKVYSVYDSKAEAFLRPFFAPTAGVAVRGFEQACCDPSHDFHKYGADYTLFEIGVFDEFNGRLEAHVAHINLGNGLAVLAQAGAGGSSRGDHGDSEATSPEVPPRLVDDRQGSLV